MRRGVSIAPAIRVAVENALGQTDVSDNTTPVTLSFSQNPGGGTLAGSVTATAAGGIATGADALSHRVMTWLIEALALVVPPLDAWTRTAWLVDARAAWNALGGIATHAVLFVAVLAAAAVFDLSRRNF